MHKSAAIGFIGKRVAFNLGPRGAYEGVLEEIAGRYHWQCFIRVDTITGLPTARNPFLQFNERVRVPGIVIRRARKKSSHTYREQVLTLMSFEHAAIERMRRECMVNGVVVSAAAIALRFCQKAHSKRMEEVLSMDAVRTATDNPHPKGTSPPGAKYPAQMSMR